MQWFRVYHDMVSDPKLHEIARRAKVSRGMVIAAWVSILTTASKSEERGVASGINPVQLGYLIDAKPAVAERILASIVEQGMMLPDGAVKAWAERQRTSDDVNLRVRRARGLKTKPLENNETDGQCNVTNSSRFREDKIESTTVDSPPITPHSPIDDPQLEPEPEPEPEFELAPVPTGTVLVAYGSTPSLPAKAEAVPYEIAAAIWNETCGDLMPKCKSWPKGRTRAFATRFKNNCKGNLEIWREVCQRVRSSAFCCGENDRGWRADIDFALQESSWAKIIEGKYDNTARRQKPTGVIGALAILREKDIRDGRHPEDDGMSDYERELLSRPSWQDALEGPKH